MNCESAQQNILLAQYGELPDELQFPLEQHLHSCEECRREWNAVLALHEQLALVPVLEPSPNLLAGSRMQLDEALDEMPPRSLGQRLWGNAYRWLGYVQGAPALTVLLLGVGFLGGDVLVRYQVMSAVNKVPPVVTMSTPTDGPITSITGIVPTPNSDIVQVKYNRVISETMQGTLDEPRVRELLMMGTKLGANNDVHATSVDLLAGECLAGHNCDGDGDGTRGIRTTLLTSLRYDKDPGDRMKALAGLQRYVAEDENVRYAVLDTLMRDQSTQVRARAVALLEPVHADSSVRQVLRTVSAQDANPAIRYASYQALQGTADIE